MQQPITKHKQVQKHCDRAVRSGSGYY